MAQSYNHGHIANQANDQHFHAGAQLIIGSPISIAPPPDYDLGVRFGLTPQIDDDLFIGREDELRQLTAWLVPTAAKQNVVAIHGMGGVGKTQLSVQLVRRAGEQYSAVYWLDATSTSSLRAGLAALALEAESASIDACEEELLVQNARRWLSHKDNNRWLLIYDNYDDPRLPGMSSTTGFDIRMYFPVRAHGSILITTRSPELKFAKLLYLKKLDDESQSLSILAIRSGRSVDGDPWAARLVQRFDGLPLALATAGSYLCQSTDSFEDYLRLYNESWSDLGQDGGGPVEYEERTLYTTWNISLKQIQDRDMVAAKLLQLLAYFDSHKLWYELFYAGRNLENAPPWWVELVQSQVRFSRATRTLCEYSILDKVDDHHSLHYCVHDWITEHLNREPDAELYRIAMHCIAQSISYESKKKDWGWTRQLIAHAVRLQHSRLQQNSILITANISIYISSDLYGLALLYRLGYMYEEAEEMYTWALAGLEKAVGSQHPKTLEVMATCASCYAARDKFEEAENMYQRALNGQEEVLTSNHPSTLGTMSSLGVIYHRQHKLEMAEEMFERALAGLKTSPEQSRIEILRMMNNLALVYLEQGKCEKVMEMLKQAWAAQEGLSAQDRFSALRDIGNPPLL